MACFLEPLMLRLILSHERALPNDLSLHRICGEQFHHFHGEAVVHQTSDDSSSRFLVRIHDPETSETDELSARFIASIRASAIPRYSPSSSIPMNRWSNSKEATPVVPEPQNGSSTSESGAHEASRHLFTSSTGFCGGCDPCAFSAFDGALNYHTVFICFPPFASRIRS